MRCLLDTHAFLWWISDDARLSSTARRILEDSENDIVFSAVSAWEIAIKSQLGRITFADDPAIVVREQLSANGFHQLDIEVRHALQVFSLPMLHRDPFDRLLIAQAVVEEVSLLSSDAAIQAYNIPIIW